MAVRQTVTAPSPPVLGNEGFKTMVSHTGIGTMAVGSWQLAVGSWQLAVGS